MRPTRSAALLLLALAAAAQAQVLETPVGRAEFIGLKKSAAQTWMDRLIEHDKPRKPHICAATFKKLGLADVAVEWIFNEDGRVIFVTCIEDASQLSKRPEPSQDSRELPVRWQGIMDGLKNPGEFQFAILHFGRLLAEPQKKQAALVEDVRASMGGELQCPEAALTGGWDAIASAAAPEDLDLALWTIAHDKSVANRVAASCVLLNFTEDDRAWHALISAQLDRDERVSGAAGQSLFSLVKDHTRKVDWAPAAENLRAILAGANPWALRKTIEALNLTAVSPELAAQVIPKGGGLIVEYAKAQEPKTRALGLTLLRTLSGKPSADADELAAWAESLHD